MRLIVVLEDPNAVDPAETAEEAAPSSQRHSPRFETSVGEVCGVGASKDRSFLILRLGFLFDVSVGDTLGFGEDCGFGLVVFWVYRVSW